MKTLIIFLTLIIFSTVNSYSKETIDCKSLKKFSIQYSIWKTKAALSGNDSISSEKNKTGKKGKDLFKPIRLALTGKDKGPELKYLLPLLTKEHILKKLGYI